MSLQTQLRREAGPNTDKTTTGKMAKRKHQISTLYSQMKNQELESLGKGNAGFKTKAETQAKYGW